MRLGELIETLGAFDLELPVRFSTGGTPSEFGSVAHLTGEDQ